MHQYLRSQGVLDVNRAVFIAHAAACGLGAAHQQGIVHRRVKTRNILLGRDSSVKITDFGALSLLFEVRCCQPEQATGMSLTPAADVYALGVVLYEMLAGRAPFEGDTPPAIGIQHVHNLPVTLRHFNSAIPPTLEAIILRCLQKQPEMRYPDGNALAMALEHL